MRALAGQGFPVVGLTSPPGRKPRGRVPVHPFDRLHGTETGALIPGEDLATGHRNDKYITAYHGTAPSLFRKLLRRWRGLALHAVERTAFVDIGAGKGRAMLLASELPFRRIVGCELHPALAASARANLSRFQKQHLAPPMRLVEDDVLRLRFPAGPCVLFLFNPFDTVLMDRFLLRLARVFALRPGELDLLYVNDEQRDLFQHEHPRFRELWRGRVTMSPEDRLADRAIIEHHAKGLYVTTGYEDCTVYRFE